MSNKKDNLGFRNQDKNIRNKFSNRRGKSKDLRVSSNNVLSLKENLKEEKEDIKSRPYVFDKTLTKMIKFQLILFMEKKGEGMMKKQWMLFLAGCLLMLPVLAHAQLDRLVEGLLGGKEQGIRSEDLKVHQLEFSPDPVREGQRLAFRASISNSSRYSGRVTILIKDRDQIISEVTNAVLRPGDNQVAFPETSYRFSGSDHCFTVVADIEHTRTPIDAERQFCAKKTYSGWTLSDKATGSLYVEDLDMEPDPASPGQEIRFRVKLRNDGRPIRGTIQIKDRDQVVVKVDNTNIPHGLTEYQFPRTRYTFQRFDTCFTVLVDSERTPYPVDARSKYCASPVGWTLRPGMREQRGERGR